MRPRDYQKTRFRFGVWALSASAIAGLMTPTAIIAPARAAVLHGWNFDPATKALTITLPDGITPEFFLLAEPARIVLEIPDTTLGTLTTAQAYSGAVRSIRLMEAADGSRLVLELAPNTRLDPRHAELTAIALDNGQTQWSLQPLLQDSPPAPIAAGTSTADTDVANSPAASESTNGAVPPSVASAPEPSLSTASEESASGEGDVAESSEESAVIESPDFTETEMEVTDSATEPAAIDGAETSADTEAASALSAPALPAESPSLPEIANTATVGAVQSLPDEIAPPVSETADNAETRNSAADGAEIEDTADDELVESVPAAIAAPAAVATETATDSVAAVAEESVPIPVTTADVPPAPSEAAAEESALPDIAHEVTAEVVRSLPTGPDPLADVNTEAATLAGITVENLDALPPGEVPAAPMAPSASSQAAVSVPSLAEADSTPAPAAPALASEPPANQDLAAATSTAGQPANQVRPPNSVNASPVQAVPTEPPLAPAVATVPAAETVTPPIPLPPAVTAPPAIAATAMEVPRLRGPPPTWSDRTASSDVANQTGPSAAPAASATAYITQSPPTVAQAAVEGSTAYITQSPPRTSAVGPATAYITQSPPSTAAAPPATAYITERPPTTVASAPTAATEYITEPPPIAAPSTAATEYITEPPPRATASTSTAATASTAAPPTAAPAGTEVATVPPPPRAIAASSTSDTPPFLPAPSASDDDAPRERPTIPPPPTRAVGGPDTVPFGAPLPPTEAGQSELQGYNSLLPAGTSLPLQYTGAAPLTLAADKPVEQALSLTEDIYDADTGALLLAAGTQVWGRFENIDDNDRRFIAESVVYGRDRFPLAAESDQIAGVQQSRDRNLAITSSIESATITALSGFPGIGLIGGAAIGALTSFVQSPTIVAIAPGTVLAVEVTSENSSIAGDAEPE
ncbi:MAG: AMIN domain-containing protein [Leptolyngbyaceae cyanobacterium]